MIDLKLYKAKVVSIDDKDKKGKVQIQILPELKDVATKDLPWAIPFSSANSVTVFSNDPPEEGSLIRVLVDQYWKRFYYLGNTLFYDVFNFDTVKGKLDSATELSNKDYKNLKFRMYKDGGVEFHNNSTGEHGFIHKSGSYIMFDKDGYVIQKDKDGSTYKTSSSGITIEDKNGNTFITSSSSVKINGNLEILQ